jgi:hypothetical protein
MPFHFAHEIFDETNVERHSALQDVSILLVISLSYSHGPRPLADALLLFLAIEIWDESREIDSSGRTYPFEYFMVLLTRAKVFC